MKKEKSIPSFIYIFGPVVRYILVSELVYALMGFLWNGRLQEMILQGKGTAAFSHVLQTVWAYLCIIIPAAAGCLAVVRDAGIERTAFPNGQRQRQLAALDRVNEWKAERIVKTGRDRRSRGFPFILVYAAAQDKISRRVISILLPCAVFLSLGINVLASCSVPDSVPQISQGTLTGISGILVQALCYCIFMPYVEETVFRAVLYPRLQRGFGTGWAVFGSAVLFGVYHGNPVQAVYALVLGIVFAGAYEVFGRFELPFALHGMCNLSVLGLQWSGTYESVCTPAWAAVFLGAAACGFYTISVIIRKEINAA